MKIGGGVSLNKSLEALFAFIYNDLGLTKIFLKVQKIWTGGVTPVLEETQVKAAFCVNEFPDTLPYSTFYSVSANETIQ